LRTDPVIKEIKDDPPEAGAVSRVPAAMPDEGAGVIQAVLQDGYLQRPSDGVLLGRGRALFPSPARFRQFDLFKRLCQLGFFLVDLGTVHSGLTANITDRSFQAEARLYGMVSGQEVQCDQ